MTPSVPTLTRLRAEDLGGVDTPGQARALDIVNTFMADVCNTLRVLAAQQQPLEEKRFTTPAAGNGVLTLSTDYEKVTHVSATVRRADGAAITSAYSYTFKNLPNRLLEVQFQGLSASTSYLASLVVR